MIFSKRSFPLIFIFSIIFSSAYVFVTGAENVVAQSTPPVDASAAADTVPAKKVFPVKKYKQDTYEELTTTYPMDAPAPNNLKSVVEYDIKSGNYVLRTFIGDMEVATPFMMTAQEYQNYSAKNEMQSYWKEKNAKAGKNNEDKFSISDMKFNIGPADKLFGPGGVQIKTQGSAELLMGIKTNDIQNPTLPERMRNTSIFNFDEKIQMNISGGVGDKVSVGLNYNTESSFDFDQKMVKLAFKGKEDDIVKNLEAGNVSMQLNSALITGSTALFGIKTDLQFGKLSVSAIASQQQSETQTVSSKGGAQTTKFEVNVDAYDDNRHFFLGQYFRNTYENSMSRIPVVSSGITINRVEVWVTNKRGSFDEARNVVAFMDLGEGSASSIDNSHWGDTNLFDSLPNNKANSLYDEVKDYAEVRDIQRTNEVLSNSFSSGNGGEDYEKIESARRLTPSEYSLNPTLGYISLRSALNPDEVLGVAYEYTYGGQTYQVGEFSTDAVDAPNALLVKLLKGTSQSPKLKLWDLMMKNVYNLGAMQIQADKFVFNVVYRNDSIGTDLQYITEGNIKNKLLLKVLNLDRLDLKSELNADGKFDYIEGLTALSSTGRIIFPVLEPFGSFLAKAIGNPSTANKYVFQELYDSTLVVAQEFSDKNKFRLVGEYKASSGSEIRLNAMNVPRGSVTVSAGGVALVENVDYTVDYTMGTVNILNQSLIESGTKIDVKLENQSMFNIQRKSLSGMHLEYKFSDNFTLGGTVMHLSEMPLTYKVNTGNEPVSNTIWGMNTSWRAESQWITNVIDKLPFVNATVPSTFSIDAEYAQLIPGHSKILGSGGLAYIDDFESTKTSIDIHYPINWRLASTPFDPNANATTGFPEAATSSLDYGKNRALLSWYYVDNTLNNLKWTESTPVHLRNNEESQSNHYTRIVTVSELFPNKQNPVSTSNNMTVMNLSYYPTERGPYNFDLLKVNADGTLMNPNKRWGGIMRKLDATDFETSNIEYIEFWMMDPFIYDKEGTDKGGNLVFNLGDVSEDILKDGKKSFENGLPFIDDTTKFEKTIWGRVPKTQSTVMAFDNTPGSRVKQDVGLDGLSDEDEFKFPAYKNFVDSLTLILNPATIEKMRNDPFSPLRDPSGDNYHFYRGGDYDKAELSVLQRYKYFNGTEANSPDATNTSEDYQTSVNSLPDVEDINSDNTLNEYEKYFQYKIDIRRDSMQVGKNKIVDKITSQVKLANGNVEAVTWYQFKIPIRQYDNKVGSIRNFKSIRFVRMFLTDFEKESHLRFATMDLVRGEWRNFTKALNVPSIPPISNGQIDVLAVNVEENSDKIPVNYILPPGVRREVDPGQAQIKQNEQSMVMRVTNLAPSDARGVYKTTAYDMRQYKRLQMFVHAEKLNEDLTDLKDYELSCFIRIGSDMINNYYEYEIPLKLTPAGIYSSSKLTDKQTVWYPENMFDFSFDTLIKAKLKRNVEKGNSSSVSNIIPYIVFDGNKKITVVGNPSVSDVQNIMIGIRNVGRDIKSGEVWLNELRMSEFEEEGGWAAMGNMALGLSDIGNVKVSGRVETAGYGSLESTVMNRRLDNLYQMNFSTAMELGRFLPEAIKFQIPAYYAYTNQTITPKYNPLDQDVLMSDALDAMTNPIQRDSLKQMSDAVETSRSFNVTGAKINIKSKTPQFYDPSNVAFNYAYTERNQHSAEVEKNLETTERAGVNYAFNFGAKPWEPFAKVKTLDKPLFKIIKDFNLNYMPNSIAYTTDMSRQFSQIKLRDFNATPTAASSADNFDLNFSKDFMWNRQFDIKYDLTKSMRFSLQTAMNSNIIEPRLTPEIGKEYYESWRDTVWTNIKKMGSPYTYQQTFSASWALPINKLPLLDWVTSNASYNSTYDWKKMAQISGGGEVGNIATSMGAWQADGQFNFESLYNKSKYLKKINQQYAKQNSKKPKFQSRTYSETLNFQKDSMRSIGHRLGSDKLLIATKDKLGNSVPISYKIKNATMIELTPKVSMDSVLLVVTSQDPEEQSASAKTVGFLVRSLMMVRRASITYRQSNSMVLPGFFPEAGFLGQQKDANGLYAPGYAFAFGFSDKQRTIDNAWNNGWLSKSDSIINPASTAFTADLDLNATIEPIKGLKIDLTAKRYTSQNEIIQFMFTGAPTSFTGSYNITQISIATAFKRIGTATENYKSELFDTFLANRQIVKAGLDSKYIGTNYPNTGFMSGNALASQKYDATKGYGLNSADVLIPSFLAAYTGKDVKSLDTNPFLSIAKLLPNWRVSYDGLSSLEFVKNNFKSISLTHAYTCRYSIGSYTSFSTWVAMGNDDSALGYIRDVQSDNPLPSSKYDISSVSLTEMFSPLIGVNAVLKNSMTAKFEYRKQRNLALNLSSTQLIESQTDEFLVGWGYLLKDFDVILKIANKQTNVKNDLKLSADMSIKDIKTLLRKVEENITQASSGNKLFTLKFMADYVFSSKINIQLFYDRQSTIPLISSAYPVATTNFGVSFKFMLTR